MDALAEVLRSVRLTGGVFLDVRLTAPWCVLAEMEAKDCEPYLTAPSHLIAYHVVLEGSARVDIDGVPPVEVGAGEIVLLPRNDRHTLASAADARPIAARALIEPSEDGGLARIVHGGGGAPTHIVCGFLGGEEHFNPVIETLPRMLKLDVRQGASRDWVEASVRFAARELADGRIGSPSVMARLSELLFIEAVRTYAAEGGAREAGWLRGLADPRIGRALARIHGALATPWTADALAREAGLSRSAFVQRFTTLIGVPPIRYVTAWRLRTAALYLRESQRSIGELAYAVGYASEEAFSRAFKRAYGQSPARWRAEAARR